MTSIISERDFQKARKAIQESRNSKQEVIFSSPDDELNRKILEKEQVDTFLISLKGRKDRAKQRDSGFNQVLAKVAQKKGVIIGIDLDEILESDKKVKAEILARLRQNINLCKKNKLKMQFISQKHNKEKHDLKALGLMLGMPTSMTKSL